MRFESKESLSERLKRWRERSPWVLSIVLLGYILGSLSNATHAVDDLLIFAHLKRDALQLTRDDARSKFSRDLTRSAWHRLYATRRYINTRQYSQADQDRAWDKYAAVFEDWQRDLMANIMTLEQEYGHNKRTQFEDVIQPQFMKIHGCIEGLRRPNTTIKCELSADHDIAQIETAIDNLNNDLYCFVTGLPMKDNTCPWN